MTPRAMGALAGVVLSALVPAAAACADPWPWLVPSAREADGVSSVLLMGDTNIFERSDHRIAFGEMADTLAAADIRFANAEGLFAGTSNDPTQPDIPHKTAFKPWRHSQPDQVQTLVQGGIDIVGVASNVSYPASALMRSLAVLDKAGIAYVGGGKNLAAARTPVVIERDGTRYGFLQYTTLLFPYSHAASETLPGVAPLVVHTAYQRPRQLDKPGQPPIVVTHIDYSARAMLAEDIKALRTRADIVIVSMQWGLSNTNTPVGYQSELARLMIDAGADIIFGHGPHRYQMIEAYRGRPIFHSVAQGMFDFPHNADPEREGLIVRLVARRGKLIDIALVPTWITDTPAGKVLRLLDPGTGKGADLFAELQRVNTAGIPLRVEGREIRLAVPQDPAAVAQ